MSLQIEVPEPVPPSALSRIVTEVRRIIRDCEPSLHSQNLTFRCGANGEPAGVSGDHDNLMYHVEFASSSSDREPQSSDTPVAPGATHQPASAASPGGARSAVAASPSVKGSGGAAHGSVVVVPPWSMTGHASHATPSLCFVVSGGILPKYRDHRDATPRADDREAQSSSGLDAAALASLGHGAYAAVGDVSGVDDDGVATSAAIASEPTSVPAVTTKKSILLTVSCDGIRGWTCGWRPETVDSLLASLCELASWVRRRTFVLTSIVAHKMGSGHVVPAACPLPPVAPTARGRFAASSRFPRVKQKTQTGGGGAGMPPPSSSSHQHASGGATTRTTAATAVASSRHHHRHHHHHHRKKHGHHSADGHTSHGREHGGGVPMVGVPMAGVPMAGAGRGPGQVSHAAAHTLLATPTEARAASAMPTTMRSVTYTAGAMAAAGSRTTVPSPGTRGTAASPSTQVP